MSLRKKQSEFTYAIAKLIMFAYDELGVELTFGDAHRDSRVHGEYGEKLSYSSALSNHKLRLAVDLNLFVCGNYIVGHHDMWDKLHEYWESIGGSSIINGDENHFSFEHKGKK